MCVLYVCLYVRVCVCLYVCVRAGLGAHHMAWPTETTSIGSYTMHPIMFLPSHTLCLLEWSSRIT